MAEEAKRKEITGLYRNVELLRLERNIKSVRQLETQAGITKDSIKTWKYHLPSCEPVIALSNFFNVSTDYLLGLNKNPNSNTLNISPNTWNILKEAEAINIDERTANILMKVLRAISEE